MNRADFFRMLLAAPAAAVGVRLDWRPAPTKTTYPVADLWGQAIFMAHSSPYKIETGDYLVIGDDGLLMPLRYEMNAPIVAIALEGNAWPGATVLAVRA